MDKVTIYNPHTETARVVIDGVEYSVEAGRDLPGVPRKVAQDWQKNTHEFLIIKDNSGVQAEPTSPVPEEATKVDVKEAEEKVEVPSERPKKATK